jgi:alpha 1,6-mannosyltransferase
MAYKNIKSATKRCLVASKPETTGTVPLQNSFTMARNFLSSRTRALYLALVMASMVFLWRIADIQPFKNNLIIMSPPAQYTFPRKIWQTWTTQISGLSARNEGGVEAWQSLNEQYRYELLTNLAAETYVRDKFYHTRPDIAAAYLAMSDSILRADFLRYLVLFADGGVYSDIDTKANRPVDEWVPSMFARKARLVIGIDTDQSDRHPYPFVLCQSTIMSHPGHRVMEIIISNILEKLPVIIETLRRGPLSEKAVLESTGPPAFTSAVLQHLRAELGDDFTIDSISGLSKPALFADVLIFPAVTFMAGSGHSNSGSVDDNSVLVEHFFQGSWRDTHV